LRPLHDQIYAFLKSKKEVDGTFDQDYQRMRVKEVTRFARFKGITLYSYDLTAATDRFPVLFQGVCLYFGGFLKNIIDVIL
jgi:hypothetical protein